MSPCFVIFDCDGVLVDSEVLSAEVEAEELIRLGVAIDAQQARQWFLGLTREDIERKILRELGLILPADYEQTLMRSLMTAYKSRLQPMKGVHALIDRLKVPFCVASNSLPGKLGLALSLTGLFERLYPNVFCSKLVARGKPAPDLFLYSMKKLGGTPEQTVVVEDSIAGVTAAKCAGMTAIGFVGGLHHDPASADALRAAGADHIARSMEEVGRITGL